MRQNKKRVQNQIDKCRAAIFESFEDAIEFVNKDKYNCYSIEKVYDGVRLLYRYNINHPMFIDVKNKEGFTQIQGAIDPQSRAPSTD